MGFFDNLGKKASSVYDATAEKTSKLAIISGIIVAVIYLFYYILIN